LKPNDVGIFNAYGPVAVNREAINIVWDLYCFAQLSRHSIRKRKAGSTERSRFCAEA
jgi:hypothetical protein